VKHAKGASSNLMTQTVARGEFFKWQGYYGAFTLGKRHVPVVRDYVLRQEEHHRAGRLHAELERVSEDRRTPVSAQADSVKL
jgi:putative transposase